MATPEEAEAAVKKAVILPGVRKRLAATDPVSHSVKTYDEVKTYGEKDRRGT